MSIAQRLIRLEQRGRLMDRPVTAALHELLQRLTDDELAIMEAVLARRAAGQTPSAVDVRAAQAAWERLCALESEGPC
jgi:hypothetical protein